MQKLIKPHLLGFLISLSVIIFFSAWAYIKGESLKESFSILFKASLVALAITLISFAFEALVRKRV